MLENFTTLFSCLIFIVSVYIYGLILLDKPQNNKKMNIVIFIILCVLQYIIYMNILGTLKTVLLCIIYSIMFNQIFSIKFGKSVLLSIIYAILTIIPDLLVLIIFTKIFNVSKEIYYSSMAGGIVTNSAVCILMILLIYIIRKPLRKLMNYKVSENLKIVFISLLTLITLALFFYNLIKTYEFNNNILRYIIVILSLIAIIFNIFKQKIENENILKRYDVMLNTIGEYEKDVEEQRKLIHETRNELMTVRCKLLDKSSKEDIFEYLDSLMGDKVSGKMSNYSKFNYLPPNGLKGFLYYKFMEAEKEGVNAIINVSSGVENSFLKDLDTNNFKCLGRILGVYLDNAIEASAKSKEKKLGVEIYLVKNNIKIIISNTYNNEINLDKMGNERISTKGRNRGHGLLLVSKILTENKIFDVKSTAKNGIYTQELTIENPVK